MGESEVQVRGERRGASTLSLSRAQARELPGAFGDPLRAVDALPGFVPTISGLPIFFLRGAPPASVTYSVDGVEVPLLFHAFLGPSVLHPALLSGVEIQHAPADARHGGGAGAAILAHAAAPAERFSGEANLRLFDAGAFVASPFADGHGHVQLGGRYSFTGLLYSALSDDEFGYWDYQLRASREITPANSVGLFVFGAGDHYGGESLAGAVGGDTGFHRADLRFRHARGGFEWLSAVTLGRDRTADDAAELTDLSLRLRSEARVRASPAVSLDFGVQGRLDSVSLDVEPQRPDRLDLLELFPTRTDSSAGSFLSLRFTPSPRLQIEPGVRADLYISRGERALGVDPRLSVTAQLSSRIAVEHRVGVASQRPNFVPGVPAAQVGSLDQGLVRGLHSSSAVRGALPGEFSLSVAGFLSEYHDVIDPLGDARDFKLDRSVLDARHDLAARGVELRLARPLTRRAGGYVAYTLSWSERRALRTESPSGYDRRHVLQGALATELVWQLRASARALYYTGFPALLIGASGADLSNDLRAPGFFRVDARLERVFRVSRELELSVVAESLNATGAKEPLRYECGGRCELVTAGPVSLPSLGVEARF
jgi:hypothetical protein